MKFMDKHYNYAWNVSSFFLTLLIGVSKSYEFYTSTALETKIITSEKLLIFSDDFGFGFLKKQIRLQETKTAHKTWKLIKRITSRVLVTRLWFRAEEIIQCNTINSTEFSAKNQDTSRSRPIFHRGCHNNLRREISRRYLKNNSHV